MRRILSVGVVVGLVGAGILVAPTAMVGQRASRFDRERVNGRDVVAREVIVKFRQPPVASELAQLRADGDAADLQPVGRAGALHLRSRSRSAAALLAALARRPDVAYAEPNYIVRIVSEPNDPRYQELWALHNLGQPIGGVSGASGADIHAVPAWNISLGSTANVVAVIDTGIDYTHADLAANMWSAPTAFTVNVGGAAVTCAAGTHGFNAITRTCDPMDDEDHGTHVAGTIGATGDNGTGVVGVNWTTRLMAIKFIDATGSGTTADAIAAVEFALAVKQRFAATAAANIRVLSNSWGGPDFSQALLDEVSAANDADMLFVAGAGNDGFDNDILPFYPASFDAPNVVSVTATDNTDDLAWFSNYGASSVHIGAPGVDILSTTIGNHYQYLSGTSMATPQVSGAAALVLSACAINTAELKDTILGTVDPIPILASATTSGGRLNVHSAIYSCIAPPQTPANLTAHGADVKVNLAWSAALGALRYNVKRSLTAGGPYSSLNAAVHGTSYTDAGLANGTTYYYVVSAINSQGESGDSNEAFATANIPPDVIVSALTTPSTSGVGATIGVSATTKNQGAGTAKPSTTNFYLSNNSTLDVSDVLLNTQAVPQLLAGTMSSTSVSLVIPSTTTGTHYLIAKADADDVLDESNENNNAVARSIQIGPDLAVSALTVPGNGGADATIVVNDTTKNQGGGSATATVTRFYLSTNSVLDATDSLLGSRDVVALDPGLTSVASTTLAIPASTAPGSYYVLAKADADGSLTETSEANNTTARSIVIGGDLVVSTMTVPAKAGSGAMITVTDTTSNLGGGAAASSVTRFYLSTNTMLDAGDTLLGGSHTVPDLAPGGVDNSSMSLVLPAVATGAYYVIAKADDDNVVLESKETNNTLGRPIAIGGDLSVSAFTVPALGGAGLSLSVSDSTTNLGGGSMASSTTRFYLSLNSVPDGTDTALGSRAVAALDPGVVNSASTSLTIPFSTAPGSYYVIAKADADGLLTETSETNNTIARSIVIGGDLSVTAMTVPAKAGSGASISVTDATSNVGGGTAAASVTRFYFSTNSTLDSGDTLLVGAHVVPDLPPGAVHNGAIALTLPTVTSGTYYVIARADDTDVVAESKETNNTVARSIAIGGDLLLTAFTVPAEAGAGSPLTVTDSTTNQGGGSMVATTTRLYLSTNSVLDANDTLLGGRAVPALAAGATSSGNTTVTIPGSVVSGSYYLIAKADADDAVPETVETNNTLVRSVQIGSDLAVSAITAPAKAGAGSPIVISETTTNQGGGDAAASVTAFYLSTSSSGTASDVLLDTSHAVPPLTAGASSAGSTTATIPAGTASGTFYIIARADNGNVIAETVETNNVKSRSISIGPDLTVPTFSLSASSVTVGAALTISETVTNAGAGTAGASTTRFYLSTNTILDASDVLLAPGRAVPQLAGGAASAGSTVVTIPFDTAPRTYYVIAAADGDGAIAESVETNNLSSARSLQVAAAP